MREERYTSEDGFTVYIDENGDLCSRDGWGELEECVVKGLVRSVEDFYRHKRDKGLGIWRNPERPNEVVYSIEKDRIYVLNESRGWTSIWERKQVENDAYVDHFGFDTAHAYFTAISKPWHEAKEGEVWELSMESYDPGEYWLVKSGGFKRNAFLPAVSLDSPAITAGYRIWPTKED